MSSLVILLIAFIAVTGSSNNVESSPAQALDLSRVLKLFNQQRLNAAPSKQRKLRLRIVSSDSNSNSDDSSTDLDDSDTNLLASLRNDRIVNLIETVAKQKTNNNRLSYRKGKKNYKQPSDKTDDSDNKRLAKEKERIIDLIESVAKQKNNNNRLSYHKGKKNYEQPSDKSDDSDNKRLAKERIIGLIDTVAKANNKKDSTTNRKGKQNYGQIRYLISSSENYDNTQNNVQKQILENLFSQPSNDMEQQLKPKKKLIPNRLTPTVTMDDVKKYYENKNKNVEVTGLGDYSKVYIVLNPKAVKNSKNKNSLNDLISKVLSLSAPTSHREPQDKILPFRYKGFKVNDNRLKRRFKGINNNIARMRDDEKKLDPLAAPLVSALGGIPRITAMAT